MPKGATPNMIRTTLFLPGEMLARVRTLADQEETPIIELIRRVIDLITTFDIPPVSAPIPPILPGTTTERFIASIPQPQLTSLSVAADRRGITQHELIRQGMYIYLARKAKQGFITSPPRPLDNSPLP